MWAKLELIIIIFILYKMRRQLVIITIAIKRWVFVFIVKVLCVESDVRSQSESISNWQKIYALANTFVVIPFLTVHEHTRWCVRREYSQLHPSGVRGKKIKSSIPRSKMVALFTEEDLEEISGPCRYLVREEEEGLGTLESTSSY